MSGGKLFKSLIVDDSRIPVANGTVIAAHDTGKAYKFSRMKSASARIQQFEIKFVVKNVGNFRELVMIEANVGIVDSGKEVIGIASIGFQG